MKAKRILSGLISAVVAISATFSMVSFTASADETFDDLNQEQITAAMGAGWNLGNQLEATNEAGEPNETAWGNPVIRKELLQTVKKAGFKSVRIPISYLTKIGPQTTYKIDEAWLNRIKEVVDYAIEEDLYVIINMHADGYYDTVKGAWLDCSASYQTTIVNKFKACWKQIAEKFANYDEHLIFESMNEVGASGTPTETVYNNINNYNQVFVDTVRQTSENNSKRWLLVPGWYTNINYTVGSYFAIPSDTYRDTSIPESEKRIMVSVHYYDPWDFCGDDTSGSYSQWGDDGNPNKKVNWNSDEDYMEGQLKKVYDKFVSAGYPVIIGEYGCINKTATDAANTIYRAHYVGTMCKLAKEYGCVPVYWDNGAVGNSFGLINRNTYKIEQPEMIDAMMEVYLTPKENLSRFITFISELKSDNYTTDTWNAVDTALKTAEGLVEAEGTSDEDLTKAYEDLNTAYYKLMENDSATDEYVAIRNEDEIGNSIELYEEAIALGQSPEGYAVSLKPDMMNVLSSKVLTIKFKITSAKKPAAGDTVLNLKPFDTKTWSGWNDNFVKLSDCKYDAATEEYTYTVESKKILDSYEGGIESGADGINLYYGMVVDKNGKVGNALDEDGNAIFDKDGVAIQLTYYSASYPISHTRHHYEEGSYTFTEPTCTEQGYREYKCTACGEVYKDMYKANGHTWEAWKTVKEATCGEAGIREHTCLIDNVTEQQEIKATGKHNFVNGVCTVCGAKDIIEEPHKPENPGNNNGSTVKPGTPGNKVTPTPKTNAKADAQKIVNKAKIKNLKASAKGKKVTVKWKKASKVTGYIVQVSAKKNFKNILAKKTLKKNAKKVTIKIKKLKKGKTYWVRVRAYKTYKANGKTNKATGSWKKIKFKVNISAKSK